MSENGMDEQYVALLGRSGEPEARQAGESIFSEGDPADRMYLVSTGSISLQVGDHVVETVGPGGLFGEMAMIDRRPASWSGSTSGGSGSSCRRRPTSPSL